MKKNAWMMTIFGVAALLLPSAVAKAEFTGSTTVSASSSGAVLTEGKSQGNASGMVPEPPPSALITIGGLAFGLFARRRMARNFAE